MESFGPDRTLLTLPLEAAGKKSATKSGDTADGKVAAERKQKILEYLTDAAQATTVEIAKAVGLKPSRARDYLQALAAEGSVIAEGDRRGRRYRLKR